VQLGGYGNADTQQNITQYFTTVPAADLDVALRLDAACMQDIEDSQAEWDHEKGAIEQEVARDLSEPVYKFLTRLNEDMFSGTPYAHDALGTRDSFEATTGEMLKAFHRDWYAPNNAILVVAGDVQRAQTLARIRELYGHIQRCPIGARPAVSLGAVRHETFAIDSNLPYTLAAIAYRMPGTDSADYAATRVLADVLASQRGNIYGLVPAGRALDAQFELAETYPKASVGLAYAMLPAGTPPDAVITSLTGILADYVRSGLPAKLVDAAKHSEIASASNSTCSTTTRSSRRLCRSRPANRWRRRASAAASS
jgi:zinc protease